MGQEFFHTREKLKDWLADRENERGSTKEKLARVVWGWQEETSRHWISPGQDNPKKGTERKKGGKQ